MVVGTPTVTGAMTEGLTGPLNKAEGEARGEKLFAFTQP